MSDVSVSSPPFSSSSSKIGHKNELRAGTPLLGRKAGRAGAVQPGEEKAPGTPYSSLPVPERGL